MLRAPAKSRRWTAAAEHVVDVMPGELGGAQQARQRVPLGVLLVPLPLLCWQQRPDRVLVPAGGMRAGDVGPHRRERGQARARSSSPRMVSVAVRLGLLAFQDVGEDSEPVPGRRCVLGRPGSVRCQAQAGAPARGQQRGRVRSRRRRCCARGRGSCPHTATSRPAVSSTTRCAVSTVRLWATCTFPA